MTQKDKLLQALAYLKHGTIGQLSSINDNLNLILQHIETSSDLSVSQAELESAVKVYSSTQKFLCALASEGLGPS